MCTLWKPMSKVEEWAALHPCNPNLCYHKSAAFVKRLTLAALSTILYHRRMFSTQCFQENIFFGTKVMLLKQRSGVPLADFVSSSLLTMLDAFDKRYLHEIVFSVYEDSHRPESRLESYSFQFQYKGEFTYVSLQGNTPKVKNVNELELVQKATENMLRVAMESVREEFPLPVHFDVEIRAYCNENAPTGYCPKYFTDQRFDDELLASLKLQACVRTHTHTLIMKKYSAAAMASLQPSLEVNTVDEMSQDMQASSLLVENTERQDHEPGRSIYFNLNCVCGSDVLGDDVIKSRCILCAYCNQLQHAACYDWFKEEDPPNHCCKQCALQHPERICTDPSLLRLDTNTTRAKCVLRRTLEWCTHASWVTARLLSTSFQLSDTTLNKLLHKIERCGVLQPLPSSTQYPMEAERPVNNAAARETIEGSFSRMRQVQTSSQDSISELDSRDHRPRQNHNSEASSSPPLMQPHAYENEKLGHKTTNRAESAVRDERMHQEDKTPLMMRERPLQTTATPPVKPKKDWATKSAASAFQLIGEERGEQDMEIEELPLSGSHNPVQPQQLNITKKHKMALRRKRKEDEDDPTYTPSKRNKKN